MLILLIWTAFAAWCVWAVWPRHYLVGMDLATGPDFTVFYNIRFVKGVSTITLDGDYTP